MDSSSFPVPAGLYRTTVSYPLREQELPGGALVYVGNPVNGGVRFVVRPGRNERNRWFWGEPTFPLDDAQWESTLIALPAEGFYSLPETITLDGGGRWLENAIVQLGYNRTAEPLLFIAQWHDGGTDNALTFSDRGIRIEDELMRRLRWAPILPVPAATADA